MEHARRKLEYRRRFPENPRHAEPPHAVTNRQHMPIVIKHDNINGKQHPQGVDTLGRHNQQPVIRLQIALAQQANDPAQPGISNPDGFPQNRSAGGVHGLYEFGVESHAIT